MAARPRKYQQNVDNLYQKTDKRNGITYFTYRHPESGKFIGLGSDKEKAFAAAAEANRIFAERKSEQIHFILGKDENVVKAIGISAKEWIKRYIEIQKERLSKNELKPETVRTKINRAKLFAERFTNTGIKEITTKDIVTVLDEYKANGKESMAMNLRAHWKDIYLEAQYAGEVDTGYNPVISTRSIKLVTKRKRITNDDLTAIINTDLYQTNSILRLSVKIAVTTGLRRNDIVNLQFSHIKDGHLLVETSKSNGKVRLAFPLELTNPYLGQSLGEIIAECRRTKVVSRYLIHHVLNHQNVESTSRGQKVTPAYLTDRFLKARKQCAKSIAEKNITFHELRSFSERTYRAAGYDTKVLLGHKKQHTTDLYNDDREMSYTYIKLPGNM